MYYYHDVDVIFYLPQDLVIEKEEEVLSFLHLRIQPQLESIVLQVSYFIRSIFFY